MRNAGKRRAVELAVCLAVMTHLLFFLAVRPVNGNASKGVLVPPETSCLAGAAPAPVEGGDVRMVWSPVLFSLPSKLGFSRDLLQEKPRTRLTFKQSDETENFLEVGLVSRTAATKALPKEVTVAFQGSSVPQPPTRAVQSQGTQPAYRRIHMDPSLRERLVGGVVIPPELNKEGKAAWEIRADVCISKQGGVQHVFLEQPLEATSLNQAVIRLLHGLRFKPGDAPAEGRIEVYSPQLAPKGVDE
ncbi:MAG: hypothetical protein ABFR47_00500 [Verrucomicrobiota bacterium]